MPKTKIKPNAQLRKIVLEETNDGRDVVRYLKSVIMTIEGAPQLHGLRHKDYARTHKIAAARILARLGLEDGKRYLRRNYVRTPFRRVHPEEEDGPKREMAASTSELYRLVKKETNDGRDITRFVEIMKGYHKEYKPHLRMAAAKELIRQIEFDYDEEPTPPMPTSDEPVGASLVGAHAATSDESTTTHTESAPSSEPVGASLVGAHADTSDESTPTDSEITAHQPNHINHSSDAYRDYATQHCAPEEESIYQSIIRRASGSYNLDEAQRKTQDLIAEFDDFMAGRDSNYQPIAVPDNLITKSLTQRMDETRIYPFDPADYYDLDQDYFYYCMCQTCEQCDELDDFFEFMRELEEETDYLFEDP